MQEVYVYLLEVAFFLKAAALLHGFGSLRLDVIAGFFRDARIIYICTRRDSGSKVRFLFGFAEFMGFILSLLKISMFKVVYWAFLFAC